MLTYDLEHRGGLPLYDYLYRCIKEDILAGRLRPGERLPSKRSLARHLEVGVVTVENAYAQLAAEGYLYSQEKRGYFVSALEVQRPAAPPSRPERESAPQRSWLLDLKSTGAGTAGFPFSVWARLMRQVLSEQGPELLRFIPHNGAPELRQAISDYLYHFRGISASPEQIVVGAGTEYLYNLIVQLLGRDKIYGMEDPGYLKAGRIYILNGAKCVPIPIDRQGAPLQAVVQSGAQVLHLSPSHQFPTGAVTPIARRQALLRWAQQAPGRYIIEDDYDSEFRFTGRPIPPLQSIDRGERVIYINTFSRTLSPSLRISYMVLPNSLLELYQQQLGFYSCTVPAMEQHTLSRFLSGGYFEQHLNRSRLRYRAHRDQVIAALNASPLAGRASISGENAGLHFLLTLDTAKPDHQLAAQAEGEGLRLSFLSDYCSSPFPQWDHTLVIHYPGIDPQQLSTALERLADIL